MSPTLLYCDGDHRDLLVLTHAFPTRLSSDLDAPTGIAAPAPGTRLKARRTAIASHSRSSIRHRPGTPSTATTSPGAWRRASQPQRSVIVERPAHAIPSLRAPSDRASSPEIALKSRAQGKGVAGRVELGCRPN